MAVADMEMPVQGGVPSRGGRVVSLPLYVLYLRRSQARAGLAQSARLLRSFIAFINKDSIYVVVINTIGKAGASIYVARRLAADSRRALGSSASLSQKDGRTDGRTEGREKDMLLHPPSPVTD